MKRRLSARRAPNRPTPLCGHDDDLIEAAALDLLEPADRGLLAERLAECAECRARFADASSLAGALRQLIPAEAGDVAHATEESAFVADFRARRAADEQRHGGEEAVVSSGSQPTRLGNRRRAPIGAARLINVVSGLAAALLLLMLVGGFWFLGPGRGHVGSVGGTRPRPTATATPAFPHIPYLPGGIPTTCANLATTSSVVPLSGAVGQSPFMVGGFQRPQATIFLADASTLHVPYGWPGYLTWAAQAGLTGKITVTGVNMNGGEPLWFKSSGGTARSVVLDPLTASSRSLGGETWATGTFTVFVPRGGCYALQATWPGGGLHITFAAGNPSEAVATVQPTP
jgi:hypothetical protein